MKIVIEENDTPITIAEKLITAKREVKVGFIEKLGGMNDTMVEDMYSLDELKEICGYIQVYCNHRR